MGGASAQPAILRPLGALRVRLTAWYLATLCAILLLLGGGLFLVVRHQISRDLDDSLANAATELIRAARIREIESAHATGPVVDAIDELRIPERTLYVTDALGNPIKPASAPDWVSAAARRTGPRPLREERELGNEHTLRLHAERFRLADGTQWVAVAAADEVELEDRYAALIAAFGATALAAMVLVGVGGQFLVRKSTRPIERSMGHMQRFMADAAHELRAPLAVIRARAELALGQERSVTDYRGALRSVELEAQHLGDIVDNLLLLSRADSGELPMRWERLYLDDIVLDAARGAQALAERKGVELTVSQFDEAAVEGDRTLLHQLVMILIDNAVKFTPASGRVDVRVTAADRAATLAVSDTGNGIPAEHLPRVFDRFFRVDAARARNDGAGLGLAIARWIADEHHARIDIASGPGKGTRVIVQFAPSGNRDTGAGASGRLAS